jgi:hypothetical protein
MEGEMDVSEPKVSNTEPGGQELIQQVISLTGLPEPLINQEITEILELSGTQSSTLTMDQLRLALLDYLEALKDSDLIKEEPEIPTN